MKHLSKEVSFSIAKLLQEKGISIRSKFFYTERLGLCSLDEDGAFVYVYCHPETNKFEIVYGVDEELGEDVRYFAPTVGEVVDWIYENHGVWISVKLGYGHEYVVQSTQSPFSFIYSDGTYNSPTEAYEAAFEYFLNNLIEKP